MLGTLIGSAGTSPTVANKLIWRDLCQDCQDFFCITGLDRMQRKGEKDCEATMDQTDIRGLFR